MMKLVVLACAFFLFLTPSLAKQTPVQMALDGQSVLLQKTQTVTKNVLASVLPRAQRRLLVINEIIDDDSDDPAGPDNLDLQGLLARPQLANRERHSAKDKDISDYVRIRLAIARARAMQIYYEKWG